jgi:hypothetical protein
MITTSYDQSGLLLRVSPLCELLQELANTRLLLLQLRELLPLLRELLLQLRVLLLLRRRCSITTTSDYSALQWAI